MQDKSTITTPPEIEEISNEFDQHRFKKAYEQNEKSGGTIMIKYRELNCIAPKGDVLYALNKFRTNPQNRKGIMGSVMFALTKNYKPVLNQTATTQQAITLGQDIAIWYANEIYEGRATL